MELSIDDLLKPCRECGGTGKAPEPPKPPGGSFGRTVGYIGSDECNACNGNGQRLTNTGVAIVSLCQKAEQARVRGMPLRPM